jgi:hypothetical protein
MKYLIILVVMCLSMTTQGQVLRPNQKVINKTFTEFKIDNFRDAEFERIHFPYSVTFKYLSGIHYQFIGNKENDVLPYSMVLDNRANTTSFINKYNIFTWFIVDDEVYLKQEILWGESEGIVLIFR